jgi:hypothetical protein
MERKIYRRGVYGGEGTCSFLIKVEGSLED